MELLHCTFAYKRKDFSKKDYRRKVKKRGITYTYMLHVKNKFDLYTDIEILEFRSACDRRAVYYS